MSDIYEQHRAAFARVSGFVIARDGQRIATVAIKFPQDGAGRLYAYVQVMGAPMVRGSAAGGGYDKRSAAFADALTKLKPESYPGARATDPDILYNIETMQSARADCDSRDWTACLERAGFTVWQAV